MKAIKNRIIFVGTLFIGMIAAGPAFAHCDTLDGPVVAAGRTAIEKNEITPVLKWIKPENEIELKAAFTRTLAVRKQGKEARELADQFFLETLVRLHREGEGAPFTGLKPAGTKLDPAVELADQVLDNGKIDSLVKTVSDETATGIRRRFDAVVEKKKHADHNVDAGREYVAAYVEYVHYVEALHTTAVRPAQAHEHGAATGESAKAAHEHNH